ncbi:electron transfer flavoprotein beta subunit lysine methyltransferase-like [Haliotis rufescens]|uniref:electron transfer flavoprotein beta subunit lysine methyltransferase-like n=1 Tax=Haliotis rufescens TaxID=6454 RepID=UPI00201EC599|nr:electron transfer flavoprotein beta subunit lysine methyltransferase-like [Haliotis rufescens]XP_046378851.2 electron transfer flavoprotein beta subunit lysine methyltransferase-like [Haliotis rufescens]
MVIRRLCAHYSQITNSLVLTNIGHVTPILSCNFSNSQTVKFINSQSKKASNSQSGSVSNSQSESVSNSQSESVSNSQSESVSRSQSGSVSNSQSERVSKSQSGSISNSQSKSLCSNQNGQTLFFQSSTQAEIMKHTELTRDHLTPEIQLHLVTRKCNLWHSRGDKSPFVDPFWAFFWPGGQAVTRYILDNRDKFRQRTVLDVGSGCGASAIAAALCGAKTVVANDIDAVATVAAKLNANVNLCGITVDSRNMIGSVCNQWDVIILGDMFYDSEFVSCISDWLNHYMKAGTCVLIGDPGRLTFENHPMKSLLTKLAEYNLPEQSRLENNGLNTAGVWMLEVGT